MIKKQEPYQKILNIALEHAQEMFHEPKGLLKHPFVSPGGPYSQTLWDWDSFWASTSMLGIAKLTDNQEFFSKVLVYAKGALLNLFEYQAEDGSVPILLSDDDTDWFDSTTDPKTNMAKPVLGQYAHLLDQHDALDRDEASSLVSQLEKYYACWKQRYQHEKTGLYLWANDIAIGVDDDPATWGRPPFSSASIFLNSLLYQDLLSAVELAQNHSDTRLAEAFSKEASALKESINEFCWDPKDGLYYSVDVQCTQNLSDHRHFSTLNCNLTPFWHCLPLKIASWSSFTPLWCGLASNEQAEIMVHKHLTDTGKFWTEYGVRSLSAEEKMYSPDVSRGNPSNWLGPIWIIVNYFIWKGLESYDYGDLADQLADNINKLLADDYERNGLLHEYYNPETGIAVCGAGFWNWNLLASLMKRRGVDEQ